MTSTSTAITATTTTTSLLCVVHHKSQSHVIPIPPSHRPIDELTKIIVIHSVSSLLWSVWLSGALLSNKTNWISWAVFFFLLLLVSQLLLEVITTKVKKLKQFLTSFSWFLFVHRTCCLLFLLWFFYKQWNKIREKYNYVYNEKYK